MDRRLGLVAAACRMMDEAEQPPTLAVLASAAGLSPFHFHRMFSQVVGITPHAYGDARRVARLQDGLGAAPSVTAALYEAGFGAASRCYAAAGARLGMTPGAWRRGGALSAIRFAVVPSAVGAVLVAATGRGSCGISLGDDPAVLVRQLQNRFPRAELISGDAAFVAQAAQAVGWVAARRTVPDLPAAIQGTAFQHRVWQALRALEGGAG